LARKRGRADQIGEDHSDLAALNAGRRWAWRIRLRLRAARAEFCHSGKKFSAMTERKPQLLEVLLA
jgi:hypothetical protein